MQISICEHHINRMKDKNYMIIWVEKEKNYIQKQGKEYIINITAEMK